MKNTLQRLENLEVIALEQWRKQQEKNKGLYVKITDNTATLIGAKTLQLTGDTPLDVVIQVEDYILQTKPETVNIGASFSGVCALIPELAEYDLGREMDGYFVIHGGMCGNYYRLLADNENVTLAQIILCEALTPYFRGCLSNKEMGISFASTSCMGLVDSLESILFIITDYVRKAKEYKAAYENEPEKYRFMSKPEQPKNRWSNYFTEGDCVNE